MLRGDFVAFVPACSHARGGPRPRHRGMTLHASRGREGGAGRGPGSHDQCAANRSCGGVWGWRVAVSWPASLVSRPPTDATAAQPADGTCHTDWCRVSGIYIIVETTAARTRASPAAARGHDGERRVDKPTTPAPDYPPRASASPGTYRVRLRRLGTASVGPRVRPPHRRQLRPRGLLTGLR